MSELLTSLELRVIDEVERRGDKIAHLASELIAIPSVSPTLASEAERSLGGEAACNRLLGDRMESAGLVVDMFGPSPDRLNAVGLLRGTGGGRSLALNGHIDTVSAGYVDLWSEDPYGATVRDGRVWGRGATDMKGALAAMVISVEALSAAGIGLAGDLIVHSVIGEEVGDVEGTPSVLDRGPMPSACICAEPSHEWRDGQGAAIALVSTPALLLRVSLQGRSTHSALRHEWVHPGGRHTIGVNALEKGTELVRSLQQLERNWGFTKRHPLFPPGQFVLHPGSFHAGNSPFLPAERCVIEYIIWHHPEETAADVRDEVAQWIGHWASSEPWLAEHPPTLEWFGEFPNFSLAREHPLVDEVIAAHAAIVGSAPSITGFPAGCDATALSDAGVPTLIYGPGEISVAHSIDEYVEVAQLVEASKVFALTALRWCGTA